MDIIQETEEYEARGYNANCVVSKADMEQMNKDWWETLDFGALLHSFGITDRHPVTLEYLDYE